MVQFIFYKSFNIFSLKIIYIDSHGYTFFILSLVFRYNTVLQNEGDEIDL